MQLKEAAYMYMYIHVHVYIHVHACTCTVLLHTLSANLSFTPPVFPSPAQDAVFKKFQSSELELTALLPPSLHSHAAISDLMETKVSHVRWQQLARECVHACVSVCACVRACVRACACVCGTEIHVSFFN